MRSTRATGYMRDKVQGVQDVQEYEGCERYDQYQGHKVSEEFYVFVHKVSHPNSLKWHDIMLHYDITVLGLHHVTQ